MAKLHEDENDSSAYKTLVDITLCLTILCSRRRIGDVQFMHMNDYMFPHEATKNQAEAVQSLSATEKVLAESYKRDITGGKLTRPIVVLFPEKLQRYVDLLLEIRLRLNLVPELNKYLFTYPGVEGMDDWLKGDVLMRKYAKQGGVKDPTLLSSNRLRKQISTVMQLLNMNAVERRNLCRFLNHTEKTDRDF